MSQYLVETNADKDALNTALTTAGIQAKVEEHGTDVVILTVRPSDYDISIEDVMGNIDRLQSAIDTALAGDDEQEPDESEDLAS